MSAATIRWPTALLRPLQPRLAPRSASEPPAAPCRSVPIVIWPQIPDDGPAVPPVSPDEGRDAHGKALLVGPLGDPTSLRALDTLGADMGQIDPLVACARIGIRDVSARRRFPRRQARGLRKRRRAAAPRDHLNLTATNLTDVSVRGLRSPLSPTAGARTCRLRSTTSTATRPTTESRTRSRSAAIATARRCSPASEV